MRLVHNYWGVLLSLFITGFPFTFLLTLSYVTGIDPALEQAAATLGAGARAAVLARLLPLLAPGLAITFCLSFVQAFSVFPSAVLLGAPAGPTRVISIAAYQAAFEEYDYSMASAIAMIMGRRAARRSSRRARGLRGLRLSRPGRRRERLSDDAAGQTLARRAVLWSIARLGVWSLLRRQPRWRSSPPSWSVRSRRAGSAPGCPPGWTTHWYVSAWDEFQLGDVLTVTFEVVVRGRR